MLDPPARTRQAVSSETSIRYVFSPWNLISVRLLSRSRGSSRMVGIWGAKRTLSGQSISLAGRHSTAVENIGVGVSMGVFYPQTFIFVSEQKGLAHLLRSLLRYQDFSTKISTISSAEVGFRVKR